MEAIFQDLRYALRMLVKSPAFTAVAVLTLALGIGANTAIFSVVDALLLKMLPVKDPQQLVILGKPTTANSRANGTPEVDYFSHPLYQELRDRNSVFTGISAGGTEHQIQVDASQSGGTSDEKVVGRMVSGNYFSVLGLHAAAGRLFSESDDTAEDANPVVVLGYGYWRRRFALSPSLIGKDIRLNGYPFTVVGIAPPGFDGDVVGEEMSVYVPLSMQPEIVRGRHWRNNGNFSWLFLIGRLKPGVTAAQAQADANVILQQALHGSYGAHLSADDRNFLSTAKIEVAPGGAGFSELRGDYRVPLLLLLGIVGLVLLIACVNVANLMLARASARNKEIAVRLAIGAGRTRLLRQLLTESILLAFLGGIAGSLLSIWGVRMLVRMFDTTASLPLQPDLRVLGFTMGICLLTGILFGLAPALRALRVRVTSTLKSSVSSTTGGGHFAWGKVLVTAQVALSLLVLFAAGLLVRSLQKLMAQDFGYDRDRLVIARTDPTAAGYDRQKVKLLAEQLTAHIASAPGVRSVTYSKNGLFAGSESGDAIIVPGFSASKDEDHVAREDYVGPGYFAAVGIPILAGRGIEPQDTATSTRVAVVNESMVKHFFHDQNPIGRQFTLDDPDWKNKPFTVVGISRNAKDHGRGLREEVPPRFYQAFQQNTDVPGDLAIMIAVNGSASAAITNILSEIKATDPRLQVKFIKTLDALVIGAAGDQIAMAKLSAFFAGLALLLACVGLYGLMSYTVAGRTREIGVRMALGAQRSSVLTLVLREGLVLVAVGLAAGVPIALVSGRLLKSMLYGLSGTDPVSLGAVIGVLALVATFAGFIPARRATKVDPMVALRYE